MVTEPCVYVRNESSNPDPEYQTDGAAGFDIASNIDVAIAPGHTHLIPTGLYMIIPTGWEGQIRLRSSLGLKGLSIPNAPGTIDSDYRGEIKVMLRNEGHDIFHLDKGERIAQMVIAQSTQAKIVSMSSDDYYNYVEAHDSADSRGEGGFGSTGRK